MRISNIEQGILNTEWNVEMLPMLGMNKIMNIESGNVK
jgi:hypothetical protein